MKNKHAAKERRQRKLKVHALRQKGRTYGEISDEVGVTSATAHKDYVEISGEVGDGSPRRGKNLTQQKKEADRQGRVLEERITKGKITDIADKFGISPATVSRDLAHVTDFATEQWLVDILENKAMLRRRQAYEMYTSGEPVTDIATQLGVSTHTIYSDVKKEAKHRKRRQEV